jgi:hypothetical protein
MSKERAIKIIKNLQLTISKMNPIKNTVSNEQFPPSRVSKVKLIGIISRLIKKYKLKNIIKPSINQKTQ